MYFGKQFLLLSLSIPKRAPYPCAGTCGSLDGLDLRPDVSLK